MITRLPTSRAVSNISHQSLSIYLLLIHFLFVLPFSRLLYALFTIIIPFSYCSPSCESKKRWKMQSQRPDFTNKLLISQEILSFPYKSRLFAIPNHHEAYTSHGHLLGPSTSIHSIHRTTKCEWNWIFIRVCYLKLYININILNSTHAQTDTQKSNGLANTISVPQANFYFRFKQIPFHTRHSNLTESSVESHSITFTSFVHRTEIHLGE